MDDRRILYRDILQDDIKAQWIEIDLFLTSKKKAEFIWNPNKHYQKGVNDLIENLKYEAAKADKSELIKLSWPYLMILKLVMDQPIPQAAITRQFIIVASHGFDSNRSLSIEYLSDHHQFNI